MNIQQSKVFDYYIKRKVYRAAYIKLYKRVKLSSSDNLFPNNIAIPEGPLRSPSNTLDQLYHSKYSFISGSDEMVHFLNSAVLIYTKIWWWGGQPSSSLLQTFGEAEAFTLQRRLPSSGASDYRQPRFGWSCCHRGLGLFTVRHGQSVDGLVG